ncbi:hypothetical protein ACFQ7Z_02965 [Streptomyces virginiae]|uniref:hypothetical protein n=1 Tax=Streptomyces virginiae TaxID=1961 RepID=UPI0036C32B53
MVKKHENENPRTTPSQASGESGDDKARKQAKDAIMPGTEDAEADDALTPSPKAQPPTHKDKRRKQPDGP